MDAVWVYHQIVTPKLVEAAEEAGVELIAWTVDELDRMVELLRMGVHGVCSNDPRLFAEAEKIVGGEATGIEAPSKKEQKRASKQAKKDEKGAAKEDKKASKKPAAES